MDKFKALVHYVIANCDSPSKLGAIRLNKILWFSDLIAYRGTGNSISGSKYVKRNRGPVPAHILKVLGELQAEEKIEIKEPAAQYFPREYISLEKPDDEIFSDVEKELVGYLIKDICDNFTADGISELTHDEIWNAAVEGEEIPLAATLVNQEGDYRPEVYQWADDVLVKYCQGAA